MLCSEVAEAARWYEKMIDAREVFATFYAVSPFIRRNCARARDWARLARMMNLPVSRA